MEKKDCKILIIDDETELSKVLGDILKSDGYTDIEYADNLKKGREKIDSTQIHLILLDVMLGDGNGCAFGPPFTFTRTSTWTWIDHPVSGLHILTIIALLRLGFPSAPYL